MYVFPSVFQHQTHGYDSGNIILSFFRSDAFLFSDEWEILLKDLSFILPITLEVH